MLCEKCYNAVISKTLGEPEKKMPFGNYWNLWLKNWEKRFLKSHSYRVWVSFWVDENVLELIVVMAAQLWGCTNSHWIVRRMRCWDGVIDSIDMSLSKLQEDSEEQRSLACCSPWGRKELGMTEQLNNNWTVHFKCMNCMVCKFYLKKLSPEKKILGKYSKLHWKEFLLACLFQNDWIHWTYIHLYIYVSEWVSAFLVMSDSLWPHELYPPGSSIYRILQPGILEWVSICFSTIHIWLCQNKVNMIFIVDPNLLDDKSETQAPFIEMLIQNITFNIFNRKHRIERKDGSSSSPFLDSLPWSISGH